MEPNPERVAELDQSIDSLRTQLSALRIMRGRQIDTLNASNSLFEAVGLALHYNTDTPHPTYEIALIDERITSLSAKMNADIREKMLYTRV